MLRSAQHKCNRGDSAQSNLQSRRFGFGRGIWVLDPKIESYQRNPVDKRKKDILKSKTRDTPWELVAGITFTNVLMIKASSGGGDSNLRRAGGFERLWVEGAVIYIIIVERVGVIISPLYPLIITL